MSGSDRPGFVDAGLLASFVELAEFTLTLADSRQEVLGQFDGLLEKLVIRTRRNGLKGESTHSSD
jgi:hypothetical protein